MKRLHYTYNSIKAYLLAVQEDLKRVYKKGEAYNETGFICTAYGHGSSDHTSKSIGFGR